MFSQNKDNYFEKQFNALDAKQNTTENVWNITQNNWSNNEVQKKET